MIFGCQRGHQSLSGAKAIVQRVVKFLEKHNVAGKKVVAVLEQKSYTDHTFNTEWYYEATHDQLEAGDVVTKRGLKYYSTHGEVVPRTHVEDDKKQWVLTEPEFVKGTPSFALMPELQDMADLQCVYSAEEASKIVQGYQTFVCGVHTGYISGASHEDFFSDPLEPATGEVIKKLKKVIETTRQGLKEHPFPDKVTLVPPSGNPKDSRRTDYISASLLTEIVNVTGGAYDCLDREAVQRHDFPNRLSMIEFNIWGLCAPPHSNPFAKGCPPGRGFFPYYGPNFTLVYQTKRGLCFKSAGEWPLVTLDLPYTDETPLYAGYVPCPFETQHAWSEAVVLKSDNLLSDMPEIQDHGWFVDSVKSILSQL